MRPKSSKSNPAQGLNVSIRIWARSLWHCTFWIVSAYASFEGVCSFPSMRKACSGTKEVSPRLSETWQKLMLGPLQLSEIRYQEGATNSVDSTYKVICSWLTWKPGATTRDGPWISMVWHKPIKQEPDGIHMKDMVWGLWHCYWGKLMEKPSDFWQLGLETLNQPTR